MISGPRAVKIRAPTGIRTLVAQWRLKVSCIKVLKELETAGVYVFTGPPIRNCIEEKAASAL
jgi:hypothetical protein